MYVIIENRLGFDIAVFLESLPHKFIIRFSPDTGNPRANIICAGRDESILVPLGRELAFGQDGFGVIGTNMRDEPDARGVHKVRRCTLLSASEPTPPDGETPP